MPDDPNDWVRVRDKDTGYHITVRRSALPYGNFQVLKQEAIDPAGFVLAPDYDPTDTSVTPKKETP